MKVFISADMEGTAGIAHWHEATATHADYPQFQALMTAEVLAACDGARAAGAQEVVIKDAHDTARNILAGQLPDYARIIRGWSGHPDSMMFGLDDSFDAVIYTGYHGKAGANGNPLAHTSALVISRLIINGEVASELTYNAMTAKRYGVKSAFLSGDGDICREAAAMLPGIRTNPTLEGFGAAAVSISPAASCQRIREGVEAALREGSGGMTALQGPYEVIIEFVNPTDAYRLSWYPNARLHGPRAIAFETTDSFEVSRALRFLL